VNKLSSWLLILVAIGVLITSIVLGLSLAFVVAQAIFVALAVALVSLGPEVELRARPGRWYALNAVAWSVVTWLLVVQEVVHGLGIWWVMASVVAAGLVATAATAFERKRRLPRS
jgi:hypothetical protein